VRLETNDGKNEAYVRIKELPFLAAAQAAAIEAREEEDAMKPRIPYLGPEKVWFILRFAASRPNQNRH
jgi:hypothetical protein